MLYMSNPKEWHLERLGYASEAQLICVETYRTALDPQNHGHIAGGNNFFAVIQPPKHVRPCKVTHIVLMLWTKCRPLLSPLIQSVSTSKSPSNRRDHLNVNPIQSKILISLILNKIRINCLDSWTHNHAHDMHIVTPSASTKPQAGLTELRRSSSPNRWPVPRLKKLFAMATEIGNWRTSESVEEAIHEMRGNAGRRGADRGARQCSSTSRCHPRYLWWCQRARDAHTRRRAVAVGVRAKMPWDCAGDAMLIEQNVFFYVGTY